MVNDVRKKSTKHNLTV